MKREKRKGPTNLARHNDAKSIVAKEKAKEIVALRLQGYTLREIAEKVGFSHSGVGFALERELKAPVEGAHELKRSLLREITIVREGLMRDFIRVGDRLGRALDDPEAGPDGISKLVGARNGTAARIIAAHERLAKLDGLDKPAETIVSGSVDVTHTDRSADNLMAALERIATDMRARNVLPPPTIDVVVQDCSGPNAPEQQAESNPDDEHDDAWREDDEPL